MMSQATPRRGKDAPPATQKPRRQQAPLYATLARHLTDAIAAGTYPVGTLLPTELELGAQHGMSRQTVREALRQLTTMGILLRQPGVGTWVQREPSPVRYTHSVNSFADLEQYAKELRLVIERAEEITASGELAQFIGCREASRWLYIRGVRCAVGSDVPVAFSETYLKQGFPNIKKHLATLQGTAVHVLLEREYGEVIEEIRQQVFAIHLNEEIAGILNVPVGSPGLEIRRRFFASGGRMILSGHVVYPGAQFSYSTRFLREHTAAE
jgi:DNA-binding GntR family transcriptional regulator